MPKATSGCARGGGRFGVVAHAVRLQVPHMQVEHAQARLAWARTRALQRAVRGLDGAFRQGREPARHVRHASVMEAGLQRWGASLSQSPTLALQRHWCPPCKSTSSQRPSLPAWTSCRAARRAAAHFCCIEPQADDSRWGHRADARLCGQRSSKHRHTFAASRHSTRLLPSSSMGVGRAGSRSWTNATAYHCRCQSYGALAASCGHVRGRSLLRSICF